jgi:NADPH-dependent ferric siderophore reductase
VTRAGPGHHLTVEEVEDLSRGFRVVEFSGPALVDHPWTPTQEVEVRLGPGVRRHYTPLALDPVAGRCRILFHLVAPGPGTGWARRLAPGATVEFHGPRGGVRQPVGADRLLIGDGTAVGALHALLAARPAPPGGPAIGAIEVAPFDVEPARRLLPGLDVLPHWGEPGARLLTWSAEALADARAGRRPVPDACVLLGHAGTLRRVRADLRRAGVPRRAICTKPYWATGRTGL